MKKITLKEYECTPHTKTIFTREKPLGMTFTRGIEISTDTYDDELINLALSLEDGERVLINDEYECVCTGIINNGEDMPYTLLFFKNTVPKLARGAI